MVHRNES
jgi:hypothetical protein